MRLKLTLYRQKAFYLLTFILLLLLFISHISSKEVYQSDSGKIFGTEYHITYLSKINFKQEIKAELEAFDASVSMFNDTSVISKVNRNETVLLDEYFLSVFRKAQQVSQQTGGAFDVTVAPLVNAWGFGRKQQSTIDIDKRVVDSLLSFVGYRKVYLHNGRILKADSRTQLDFSAIAKGYGVDVVAHLLERRGVYDYMIEIGGEIVARGKSPKQDDQEDRLWRVGIAKPKDDSLSINPSLQKVFQLTNKGMATSGNYRKYYYKNGQKRSHTINPITGYPIRHSLLSATVIATDCMTADAYATAFMVMGLDKAKAFVDNHPDIDAYFIYTDRQGKLKELSTSGIKKYISNDDNDE